MKQRSAILDFLQRHAATASWLGIYILFALDGMRHLGFLDGLLMAVVTIIPLRILHLIMKTWLVPKYLRRRTLIFALLTFLLMVALLIGAILLETWFLEWRDLPLPGSQRGDTPWVYMHVKYGSLLLLTAAQVSISFLLNEREALTQELKDSRTEMQLKYLHMQINPHFLFNALNNVYALTVLQDEKAPETVLKLSEMMRYVIDDSSKASIPVKKELTYIRDYIDFNQLRLGDKGDVTFESEIENEDFPIAPMLLQPIVENCFKHAHLAECPDGWIKISIRQAGKHLEMSAVNTFDPKLRKEHNDKERSGVGLQNVEERIRLYYGDRGSIVGKDSKNNKGEFIYDVKIKLNEKI